MKQIMFIANNDIGFFSFEQFWEKLVKMKNNNVFMLYSVYV